MMLGLLSRLLRDRRGIIGLETAVLLVAITTTGALLSHIYISASQSAARKPESVVASALDVNFAELEGLGLGEKAVTVDLAEAKGIMDYLLGVDARQPVSVGAMEMSYELAVH